MTFFDELFGGRPAKETELVAQTRTGFSTQELDPILIAVRNLGSVSDADARRRLDRLLYDLGVRSNALTDPLTEWQRRSAIDAIDRLRSDVRRILASGDAAAAMGIWSFQQVRQSAEALPQQIGEPLASLLAPEIQAAQQEAHEAADSAEIRFYEGLIENSLDRELANVTSAKSVITQCDKALEVLGVAGRLRPEIQVYARQAMERAARYRHDKRMDEAEVAAAGGTRAGLARAERLQREALVMLQQDWQQAFPSEGFPAPTAASAPSVPQSEAAPADRKPAV